MVRELQADAAVDPGGGCRVSGHGRHFVALAGVLRVKSRFARLGNSTSTGQIPSLPPGGRRFLQAKVSLSTWWKSGAHTCPSTRHPPGFAGWMSGFRARPERIDIHPAFTGLMLEGGSTCPFRHILRPLGSILVTLGPLGAHLEP